LTNARAASTGDPHVPASDFIGRPEVLPLDASVRAPVGAGIAEQMELKTCNIDRGFEAWNAFGWEVAH
jgi:hypothetical protein